MNRKKLCFLWPIPASMINHVYWTHFLKFILAILPDHIFHQHVLCLKLTLCCNPSSYTRYALSLKSSCHARLLASRSYTSKFSDHGILVTKQKQKIRNHGPIFQASKSSNIGRVCKFLLLVGCAVSITYQKYQLGEVIAAVTT